MKNLKSIMSKADDDILDELIGACEHSMASPFKKKVEVTVAKDEPEESEGGDVDAAAVPEDMDLEQLIEMYKSLKD